MGLEGLKVAEDGIRRNSWYVNRTGTCEHRDGPCAAFSASLALLCHPSINLCHALSLACESHRIQDLHQNHLEIFRNKEFGCVAISPQNFSAFTLHELFYPRDIAK
jgi:hypothetical protein